MKRYLVKLIPNIITLIRVILAFIFIINLNYQLSLQVENQQIFYLTFVFLIICISDFIDGKIARYLNVASVSGALFDIFADLFFILPSTIITVKYNIIPMWFIMLITFNFIQFVITSKILKNCKEGKKRVFVFDYIGRIVAVCFYLIPFLSVCISYYFYQNSNFILECCIKFITLLALISMIQRIVRCIQIKQEEVVKEYF